jgi:RNA polymerase primary sigma factor
VDDLNPDDLAKGEDAQLSPEESAEVADQLLFEEHAQNEVLENEVRPELVEKAVKRLREDAIRGEGTVERTDINRAYHRLGLTIAECERVEEAIASSEIRIIDQDDWDVLPSQTEPLTKSHYLSPDDERALARKIQLANKLQSSKVAEESEFASRILAEAEQARERFVVSNQKWVWKLVRNAGERKHLSRDDLYQEGMIGLLKATNLYDPDRGFRFKSYATWWIEQYISRAIDNGEREVRLPVHLKERVRKIRKAQNEYALATGRVPNIQTLATHLGLDHERLGKLLWRIQATECAEGDAEIGEGTTLFHVIPDNDSASQFDVVARQQLSDQLTLMLRSLSAREERVLRLRFGIGVDKDETLERVGRRFGLTRERIRQVEAKALRKLKHPSRSRRLRHFLDS